jgi:cell division septation protein DedD
MEKKKLLLVAISVGVFLVLTIGAAILVFTPKNTNLPFETITGIDNPETIDAIAPPPYEYIAAVSEQEITQPASLDAVDLVRNPGGVPGLVPPTEGIYSPYEAERSNENVISVTQPTTAAVPTTAPTGRAANQSTPSASTPTATVRPAQTTTAPAQTTTTPSQTASRPAQTTTAPAQTTTTPSQTASTVAKTTTAPAQTASTQAKTTTAPAQTTTTPSQTASTQAKTTTAPAQTASTPAQVTSTPASVAITNSQSIPASQTGTKNDFWVQTGAFSTMTSAEKVKETLSTKGITSIVEDGIVNGRTLFRVRVGPYTSRNEANYWLALIQSMDGFEDSQVRTTESLR